MSNPTFQIDLDKVDDNFKPLSYVAPKYVNIRVPYTYPKYEVEFYDLMRSCAEYIDKIDCRETRIKYNHDLNKVFIARHKYAAMKLFKEIIGFTLYK